MREHESLNRFARPLAVASLALFAFGCAEKNSQENPTVITTNTIAAKTITVENTEASFLPESKRKLLETARKKGEGLIFIDLMNYDPQKSFHMFINNDNPKSQSRFSGDPRIDYTKGRDGNTIEVAIPITECNLKYSVNYSPNGVEYYTFGKIDPNTRITTTSFPLFPGECFQSFTVNVNYVLGLSPSDRNPKP